MEAVSSEPSVVRANSSIHDSPVPLGDIQGPTSKECNSESETSQPKPQFHIHGAPCQGDFAAAVRNGEPELEQVNGESMLSNTPPQSGDYPLSLISWYSEPADTQGPILRSCCSRTGCDFVQNITLHGASAPPRFSPEVESDRSDEKENKTPPPASASSISSSALISSQGQVKCKMKLEQGDNRGRRLDKCSESDKKGVERSRSVGNATGRKLGREESCPPLECPRCSRKCKSGTATPANPPGARISKRQIATARFQASSAQNSCSTARKPMKSILKPDFRGGSSRSGSEKQSSLDSLSSNQNSGGSKNGGGSMTHSDLGPRLRTKFAPPGDLNFSQERRWNESDFAGLKRIERYATLRIRRPASKAAHDCNAPQAHAQEQETARKLSFETLSQDLMIKSASHVTSSNEFGHAPPAPFTRNGSLRGRKAPAVLPCATRTSALRMLKMQEKKGMAAHERVGFDSGEFGTHAPSVPQQPTSKAAHFSNGGATTKVFSKLSSASGQTASSALKRQKQERGIQTEPILILRKPKLEFQNSKFSSRSPTPMSPDEPAPEALDPSAELLRLRQELQKYKARVIKYEHIYNAAEQENVLLGNHLREVENESKEMINFLQDEKLMLAESLAEAEAEKLSLRTKLEVQGSVVHKLEKKLNLGRSQVKEAQHDVENYTSDLESESLKTKNLQDEVALLCKKVEKLNEEHC